MSDEAATKVDAYMRFYIGDWLDGTADLTLEEEGAYLRLVLFMWRRGGVLQLDHPRLARMLKITEGRWRTLWLTLERMFIVHESNTFSHSRVMRELEHARGRAGKGRAGGSAPHASRGRKPDAPRYTPSKSQVDAEYIPGDTPDLPSHSQGQDQGQRSDQIPPTPQGVDSDSQDPTGTAYPAEFALFWAATNRHGSKYKALKSWRALGKPPAHALIASWAKWAASVKWREEGGKFQPHVTTWLNGRMHEQEPAIAAGGPAVRRPDMSIFTSIRCEWHMDALNTDRPAFRPGRSCPECKHLAALGRRGESEPLVLGTVGTEP